MTEKGPSLLCPGALVHLPGESGRIALLTPLDSPARSLENESRGRALPFWGRGGDVCRSSERVSESIRHDFGFRGGEVTEKGPSLLCPGALVHLPGQSGRIALLTPLDSPARSLEIESRGRALPFWGRGGDVCRSSERVSESIRHDFGFRGGEVTEKGLSLLCPGALVHVPGQSGRIALLTPLDSPALYFLFSTLRGAALL